MKWVNPVNRVKTWNFTRNRLIVLAIVVIFAEKLYCALKFGADLALYPELCNPPCILVAGTSIPYSLMWSLINPLWLGHFWYGIYILFFDMAVTLVMWRWKRIPKMYILAWQLMTVTFYAIPGAEYQNISVFATYPLMFLSPWFAVLPLLLKLPFPWILYDWSNPHVQCMIKCSGLQDSTHSLFIRIQGYITTYAVLMVGYLWTFRKARQLRQRFKQAAGIRLQ